MHKRPTASLSHSIPAIATQQQQQQQQQQFTRRSQRQQQQPRFEQVTADITREQAFQAQQLKHIRRAIARVADDPTSGAITTVPSSDDNDDESLQSRFPTFQVPYDRDDCVFYHISGIPIDISTRALLEQLPLIDLHQTSQILVRVPRLSALNIRQRPRVRNRFIEHACFAPTVALVILVLVIFALFVIARQRSARL